MPGTKGKSGGKRARAGRKPLYQKHEVEIRSGHGDDEGWEWVGDYKYHAEAVTAAKEWKQKDYRTRIVSYLVY